MIRRTLLLPLLLAGCSPPAAVPSGSAGVGYARPAFKDDAATNATVPDDAFPLSFVDRAGKPVDLRDYRGRSVVLVVLRGLPSSEGGGFCPSCLAQAGGLMANHAEFTRRRAEVLVVYPGPPDRVGEFLRTAQANSPGEPAVRFRLLLDPDTAACAKLGIRDDLAKPSTYVLDPAGNVVYAYVGATSTDRPSVAAVLRQVDRARPPTLPPGPP